MAAVLDQQRRVAGADNGLPGGMNVCNDNAPYESQFGDVDPLGRYRVPASTKTTVKSLGLTLYAGTPQLQTGGNVNVGSVDGVFEVLINGTIRTEIRMLGLTTHQTGFGWEDMPNRWQCANQLFTFGDGIIVPAGQVILLRLVNGSLIGRSWRGTLIGLESGAAKFHKGLKQVETTADVDISYTPAADFTLLAFRAESLQNNVLGLARCMVNDKMVFDYGRVSMQNDCSNPFDMKNCSSADGCGAGGIFINTWDMDFWPGESISHGINTWDTNDAVYQSLVFGDNTGLLPAAVFPDPNDVRNNVNYGPTGADYNGDLVSPAVGDVRSGIGYGADGTEYTGTLVVGGGSSTYSRGRVVNS